MLDDGYESLLDQSDGPNVAAEAAAAAAAAADVNVGLPQGKCSRGNK